MCRGCRQHRLLVALLENAGRRSAEAAQEKLNVIAQALAALMASRAVEDQDLEEAVTQLRDAVGATEPKHQVNPGGS